MADYTIRTMTRDDLAIAIRWAAAEGWNPGQNDADSFFAADPTGFLMGWLGDEPIAAISVVKYGTSFGFLGFYIVRPDYRGQGYGWQIWQAAMDTLQGRTIGLDGVVEQQPNYLKSGFQFAYRNIRYEGKVKDNDRRRSDAIAPLSSLPFFHVLDYDRPFFPDDRTDFLRAWLQQPEGVALGMVEQDQLRGYGVLRPCTQGYKVGPLFADRPDIAESLFAELYAQVPVGDSIYLDVPEVNEAAIAIAQNYDMTSMFETARMYCPSIPQLPINRIFGVTTFELG
jgi:ribosomal protein S18 acetylase RimI-like enzyme